MSGQTDRHKEMLIAIFCTLFGKDVISSTETTLLKRQISMQVEPDL